MRRALSYASVGWFCFRVCKLHLLSPCELALLYCPLFLINMIYIRSTYLYVYTYIYIETREREMLPTTISKLSYLGLSSFFSRPRNQVIENTAFLLCVGLCFVNPLFNQQISIVSSLVHVSEYDRFRKRQTKKRHGYTTFSY